MDESEILRLKGAIKDGPRPEQAAERLLVEAALCVQNGRRLPAGLRDTISKCLGHLADHQPLLAFGYLQDAANNESVTDDVRALSELKR